jgi:hypothetical protein
VRFSVRADDPVEARRDFGQRVAALVGRHVLDVTYWDIHNYGPAPRSWDYEDWHHAVMGVELATDSGPVSVIPTDTFFPYGVEVFDSAMSVHLSLDAENGPEGWNVGRHEAWRSRQNQAVRSASTFWETIEVGPGRRNSDGAIVSAPASYDVPVALRLDVGEAPVWFVAGQPDWPPTDKVFIPGDEIMVVFQAERLRRMGFPEGPFLAPSTTRLGE